MTEPRWKHFPASLARAEKMGLSGEPTCGACAEFIYCGVSGRSAHEKGCRFGEKYPALPELPTHTCGTCGGSGKVHERLSIFVRDPDENYVVAVPGAPRDAIRCMPIGSISVTEAVAHALLVANLNERTVALDFGPLPILVAPKSDPDALIRDWWVKAYGCTLEESLEARALGG